MTLTCCAVLQKMQAAKIDGIHALLVHAIVEQAGAFYARTRFVESGSGR